MSIAILGGSFNPVHIGHLALAEDVRLSLGFDRIIFIPAFHSPFKKTPAGATASDRLFMLEAALRGNEGFAVDSCELDRGGLSFTIDTVRYVRESYRCTPALIMGDDLVKGFPSWKEADEIARLADIIVARREGTGRLPEDCARLLGDGVRFLSNPVLPVSSSLIRARISAGESWRYLVPEAVYRYISEHKLYGCATTERHHGKG